jgi:hypothetical protein
VDVKKSIICLKKDENSVLNFFIFYSHAKETLVMVQHSVRVLKLRISSTDCRKRHRYQGQDPLYKDFFHLENSSFRHFLFFFFFYLSHPSSHTFEQIPQSIKP